MNNITIINGPNINLLGEREQSQYGKKDYKFLEEICLNRAKELNLDLELKQSNVEGEIVNKKRITKIILKSEDKIEIVNFIGGG